MAVLLNWMFLLIFVGGLPIPSFAEENTCTSKIDHLYQKYISTHDNNLDEKLRKICVPLLGYGDQCQNFIKIESIQKNLANFEYQSHPLIEFTYELPWANQFIHELQKQTMLWKMSDPTNTNKKSELKEILRMTFRNQRFINAYLLNSLLFNYGDCLSLRNFGFSCTSEIPVSEFEKFLNNKHTEFQTCSGFSSDTFQQISSIRNLSKYAPGVPIYGGRQLNIEKLDFPDEKKGILKITIPVRRGKGFTSWREYHDFFERIKTLVENFWVGDYLTDSGITMHIQTEVINKHHKKSSRINATTDSYFLNAEAGFDPQNNKFLFKKKTIMNDNEEQNHIVLHEFGHSLGFNEKYFRISVDPKTCNIGKYLKDNEIMNNKDFGPIHIQNNELKFLYETYGTDMGKHRRTIIDQFVFSLHQIPFL